MSKNLIASPVCFSDKGLEEVLTIFAELGFRKYENLEWVSCAFDSSKSPTKYRQIQSKYNMECKSYHLPEISDDIDTSLEMVFKAARFAEKIGIEVVIFKANNRENYIKAADKFLDFIDNMDLIPVIQNHASSAIATLEDYQEVLNGINDIRMKTVLEVGHFHKIGINWKKGYDLLKGRIRLVHIKDIKDGNSVVYGQGEVDFPALFNTLSSDGYEGGYVVELEGNKNMKKKLVESLNYLMEHC